MSAKRRWQIKDMNGNVVYEDFAHCRKDLVVLAALKRIPLVGADFRGHDLSNLFLKGLVADGACFDGADLRGATLDDPERALGVVRRRPHAGRQGPERHLRRFRHDEVGMAGMRGTRTSFRYCVLDEADLSDMDSATSDFTRVRATKATVRRARLVGAEFARSTWIQCEFEGADLSHKPFCPDDPRSPSLEAHMPHRSRGAVVVGCSYDEKTVLSATVPAMRSDRVVSNVTERALYGLSTGAFALTTMKLMHGVSEEALLEHLPSLEGIPHLDTGLGVAGVVVVMLAMHVVKDGLVEKARDVMKDAMGKVVLNARQMLNSLERHGKQRLNLVAMMARNCSLEPFRRALDARSDEARSRNVFGGVRTFFDGLGQVILCDRRHLALALSALSKERVGTYLPERPVTVVRCDRKESTTTGPTAVMFMPNGCANVVWPMKGKERVTVSYGSTGEVAGCVDHRGRKRDIETLGLPPCASQRISAVFDFEMELLADHGLDGFAYPRDTHYVTSGSDGTILVRNLRSHTLDNPEKGSPALVRMDDTGIISRNGRLGADWSLPLRMPKQEAEMPEEDVAVPSISPA